MEEQANYGKEDDEDEEEQGERQVKSVMTVVHYENGDFFVTFPGDAEEATDLILHGIKAIIDAVIEGRCQKQERKLAELRTLLSSISKLN